MTPTGTVIEDLRDLLNSKEEAQANPAEGAVAQHLALAAQVAGVDLDDEGALDEFVTLVRSVVTKDKAWLKGQLRRWTASKGKAAIRAAREA